MARRLRGRGAFRCGKRAGLARAQRQTGAEDRAGPGGNLRDGVVILQAFDRIMPGSVVWRRVSKPKAGAEQETYATGEGEEEEVAEEAFDEDLLATGEMESVPFL